MSLNEKNMVSPRIVAENAGIEAAMAAGPMGVVTKGPLGVAIKAAPMMFKGAMAALPGVFLRKSTSAAQDLGAHQAKGRHVYAIDNADGDEIGFLDIDSIEDGVARVGDIVITNESDRPGPAGMRSLLKQLQEKHPEITSISGERVSGARRGGDHGMEGSGVETSIDVPPIANHAATNRTARSLEDLEEIVPPARRVASGEPLTGRAQAPGGGRYLDTDLTKKGDGLADDISDAEIEKIWQESVAAAGGPAQTWADSTGARPRGRDFWDKAMRLPMRSRYWYEISAEGFRDFFPDATDDELDILLDLVAATSPLANPHVNMRRTVGVQAQDIRGMPADQDITDSTAVRDALHHDSSLSGLKTGNFSGTFKYLQGRSGPPLSVNDRQVASTFGISGDDIANNGAAYQAISEFYMRLRDRINSRLPEGATPVETWQLQAMGWIEERTMSGNPSNDDYVEALHAIVRDLKAAGIPVPNDQLTKQILADPRVEPIMATTIDQWRKSQVATVETVTTQTDVGRQAVDIFTRAKEAGDGDVMDAYDAIVKRSVKKLIGRTKELGGRSPADVALGAVMGRPMKMTRMETGYGTFEGDLSRNARIPLPPDLSPDQVDAALSLMGKSLKQDAMAASRFTAVEPSSAVAEGATRTHGIFIHTTERVPSDAAERFAQNLPEGHDMNVREVANGIVFEVNPRFADDGPVGASDVDIEQAFQRAGLDNRYDSVILSFDHTSHYHEAGDYDKVLSKLKRKVLTDAVSDAEKYFIGKDGFNDAKAAARAYLTGRGPAPGEVVNDAGEVIATSKSRLAGAERSRLRYESHVGGLSGARTTVRKEVTKALDSDLREFVTKYGDQPPGAREPDPPNIKRDDEILADLPIESIQHGESAVPGGKLTWPGADDVISEYASRSTDFPPISVYSPDDLPGAPLMIDDGSHRFEAAKLRGDKTVKVYATPEDLAVASKGPRTLKDIVADKERMTADFLANHPDGVKLKEKFDAASAAGGFYDLREAHEALRKVDPKFEALLIEQGGGPVEGLAVFEQMAKRGRVQQARNREESVQSLKDGTSQAQDFLFTSAGDDMDAFVEDLKSAGLHVSDDGFGHVVAGLTEDAVRQMSKIQKRINSGKTVSSFDLGRLYGYSDDDIARFYQERGFGPEAFNKDRAASKAGSLKD
jgi:hypothetical protein